MHTKMKFLKKYLNNQGVTFIEMVLVVTCIAIIGSFSLPSYKNYTARTRVKYAANTMLADITNLRMKSLSMSKNHYLQFYNEKKECGYYVYEDKNQDGKYSQTEVVQKKSISAEFIGVRVKSSKDIEFTSRGIISSPTSITLSTDKIQVILDVNVLGKVSLN